MNYWLLKSEPGCWSWENQVKKGVEAWDGVRNYQAQGNMRQMALGDHAFFYHSVKEKRIVGIVKIVRAAYPDPADLKFCLVDVAPVCPVPNPVSLADIKSVPELQEIALVRQSRLSVMPIDNDTWHLLCHMGKVKAEDL